MKPFRTAPRHAVGAVFGLACLVGAGWVLPDASPQRREGTRPPGGERPLEPPPALVCPCGPEEALGPFSSWADVREYGARGDGIADDTAPLQRALAELGSRGRSVLYLPAGTFRITRTLLMTDKFAVSVIGHHPSETKVRWDGPAGGTMLVANGVTLSRWARITWDGAGRAGAGIAHQWDRSGGFAPTNLEHADEVFQDLGKGIIGGLKGGHNDAEVTIRRSSFQRCSVAGVSVESFNALDYWIWDSEFIANARGVTNEFGAGNFMVYNSLFRESSVADITITHTQFFSFRGNTSIGSRKFLQANNSGQNACHLTIQGNRILDTTDPVAIDIGNLGPVLLLDNQVRSAGRRGPVVRLDTWAEGADLVSFGNRYTVAEPITVRSPAARWWTADDRAVAEERISGGLPTVPAAAANLQRRVIEVPRRASAAVIQAAVDQASQSAGYKPVVHLPCGEYFVNQSIRLPANSDLQLTGDGHCTTLRWSGEAGGSVLRIAGPTRATVRDLALDGSGKANGITVEGADDPGARMCGDGLYQEYATTHNLLAEGLENTVVLLRGYQSQTLSGTAVRVRGSGVALGSRGKVIIAGGVASGDNPEGTIYDVTDDGVLGVLDTWYEGKSRALARLTGSGTFVLQGAKIAPDRAAGTASLEFDGFRGMAAVLNADIDGRIRIAAEGPATEALLMGIRTSEAEGFIRTGDAGRVALRNSKAYRSGQGSFQVGDEGITSLDFAKTVLAAVRGVASIAPARAGNTGSLLRLYRVATAHTRVGLHLKGDQRQ